MDYIPHLWTDDNIVRRQREHSWYPTRQPKWLFDEFGSVRGRCRACEGDKGMKHHPRCHRGQDKPE